ncbi:Abi family protein [Humibacter albus]|uniref:Abi family protein n=1 Tax=Humibacter albus TaxID=427754 RepID=UPI0003B6DED8|nr:Abi family protein [Humibacter albus]
MPRPPRPRGSLPYEKPPLSVDQLVDRLAGRGLQIPDRDRAIRYLRHIGYYRLSPYTIPFRQNGSDHLVRKGTSFDDVLDLYVFDRALRLLAMDALERVEVAVRAALTDHMSTTYDNSHWYTDPTHFRDRHRHAGLLRIVHETCEDRLNGTPDAGEDALVHRSALEHYLTTYGSPELPPSWLMVETLTIGQLTSAYRNLRNRSDRTAIAASIGLTAPVLESWLQTYVRVRNVCAHHGRLWNVGLGVYPAIPNSPSISWLQAPDTLPERSRRRLYPVLISLQSVLDTASPRSSWAKRLHTLLISRSPTNRAGMGIPEHWAEDPFWSRHIE